jgi:hypothetical protein
MDWFRIAGLQRSSTAAAFRRIRPRQMMAAQSVCCWIHFATDFCTILLTWIYNRSGGSLFLYRLFHAGMNTFRFVLPWSPPMAPVFVWVFCAVIFDRMWRHKKRAFGGF